MKKILFVTLISLFAVACGKSGGGGGNTDPNTTILNNTTNGDYVRLSVDPRQPIQLCARGTLTLADGQVADAGALGVYLSEYLDNAYRVQGQIGYLKTRNHYGEVTGSYPISGEELAQTYGSNHGRP